MLAKLEFFFSKPCSFFFSFNVIIHFETCKGPREVIQESIENKRRRVEEKESSKGNNRDKECFPLHFLLTRITGPKSSDKVLVDF